MESPHPSADDLELYSLGRLNPTREDAIQRHLLAYDPCCLVVAELEATIDVIREALRASLSMPPAPSAVR